MCVYIYTQTHCLPFLRIQMKEANMRVRVTSECPKVVLVLPYFPDNKDQLSRLLSSHDIPSLHAFPKESATYTIYTDIHIHTYTYNLYSGTAFNTTNMYM